MIYLINEFRGDGVEVNPESWTQLKVHNETKMQLEEIVEG